ncbi:MAG: RluA family pseudouridine synthase [Clostridiales bacterium]
MDKDYKIISKESNIRLDYYLSNKLNNLSRSYIKELILEGKVRINSKITKPGYKINMGDNIEVFVPEPEVLDVVAEKIKINIIYEDNYLLVVNKEKGMVVHPSNGHLKGTLVNALMFWCDGKLSQINGIIRPGIVHRIDMDTSGLLVVAKDNETHINLAKQLKEHTIKREYEALVHGTMYEETGKIEIPIGRDTVHRKKMSVRTNNGKFAVTNFSVIERLKFVTHLKLRLETGRTHQIRVHMAYIGFPIVGDSVYGNRNDKFKEKGQTLHAKNLGFIHPKTKKYIEFNSELPEYFKSLIDYYDNI